ncbi:MAG TPA: Crp/Fnr family transcriptional regulator [Gemmatimonadales bacterium]
MPTALLVEQGAIGRCLHQDGDEVIVEALGAGSWLCSTDSVGDCLGSVWSRLTLAPTTVLQLPLATFRSACDTERWLAAQVLESQARRQQTLLERIAVLRDRSPARRVAYTLLYLADVAGQPCPLGGGTRLMLSQHVIAAAADLARQTTNRELRRLHRARVVHVDRGMVCLVDRAMLADVGAGRLHVVPAPRPSACKLRNPEMTLDCAPLTLRRA